MTLAALSTGTSLTPKSPTAQADWVTSLTTQLNLYQWLRFSQGGIAGGITNTFLSIRPWYIGDPQWSKVQAYLNGGSAPSFNDHRCWAEVDIATAFQSFAQLFPAVAVPSGC